MRARRRNPEQAGNAMVEFALGIGLLWLLLAGSFAFSYSFYQYNKLQTAVASAALLASRLDYDAADAEAFRAKVRNMVVFGDPAGGGRPVVPGLKPDNVDVSLSPVGAIPAHITISVKNAKIAAVFQNFVFAGKPRVTTMYMGKVRCSGC